MSEIDWNDPNLSDEAVVRAACPDLVVVGEADEGLSGIWESGVGTLLGDDWQDCRQHPTVVAFEQANRPTERKEAAGDGFEEWWKTVEDDASIYILSPFQTKRLARAAWTACAERMKR